MPLKKPQFDRLYARIVEVGAHQPDVCQMCQHDQWSLNHDLMGLPSLHGADEAHAFGVVSCKQCGNTRFLSLRVLGLLEAPVPEPQDGTVPARE